MPFARLEREYRELTAWDFPPEWLESYSICCRNGEVHHYEVAGENKYTVVFKWENDNDMEYFLDKITWYNMVNDGNYPGSGFRLITPLYFC